MIRKSHSWLNIIPSTLASVLFISQIVVGFFLLSEISQNENLAYFGVGIYVFSGLIFGMLPTFEFRKKGGVKKGKSYIHTTKIVDTGIYSIVRHPQYLTFMLWSIAGMLLFQHWIVILLGIPVLPLTYFDMIQADKDAIDKFKEDYEKYMQNVPRANFILGIIKKVTK